MSIKKPPQLPGGLQIGNILLLLSVVFLLINIFLPGLFSEQAPQVPYSLFIDQVEDGKVSRVSVGQNQIRYQLKGETEETFGQVLSTTPIFDLELPKRLEAKGIEFAATPPPKMVGLITY